MFPKRSRQICQGDSTFSPSTFYVGEDNAKYIFHLIINNREGTLRGGGISNLITYHPLIPFPTIVSELYADTNTDTDLYS